MRSASTRWAWKRVKVPSPPEAPSKYSAGGPLRPCMSSSERRRPLTITVEYRGGQEAWYSVKGRGGVLRVSGYIAIHDVMQRVYAGEISPPD